MKYNYHKGIGMRCHITSSYGRYIIEDSDRDLRCTTTDAELYDHFAEPHTAARAYSLLREVAAVKIYNTYNPERELDGELSELVEAYELQDVITSWPYFNF